MDPRTAYPTDESRIDEYLDDNRVIGVCPPPSSQSPTHKSSFSSLAPCSTLKSKPSLDNLSLSSLSTTVTDRTDLSSDTFDVSSNSSISLNDPSSNVQYDPLVQPALIKHEIVPTPRSRQTIARARFEAARVIAGTDDRVLVVVGPCSIHNPDQALAYARLLKARMPDWPNLLIVMRSYL